MSCTHTGDNMPWLHTSHIYPISQDALQLLSEVLTVLINYKAIVHGANNFWRRISAKLNPVVSPAFIRGSQDRIPLVEYVKEIGYSDYFDGRFAFRKKAYYLHSAEKFLFKNKIWPRYWQFDAKQVAGRFDSVRDDLYFLSHPTSCLYGSESPVMLCIYVIYRSTLTVREYDAWMMQNHSYTATTI